MFSPPHFGTDSQEWIFNMFGFCEGDPDIETDKLILVLRMRFTNKVGQRTQKQDGTQRAFS